MIIKYWRSVPIIKQANQKRYFAETPQVCINRRIRTIREIISGNFSNEAALLLTDIRKVVSDRAEYNAYDFRDAIQSHVDKLWLNCAKDYIALCTFAYLDSIRGKVDNRTEKSTDSKDMESALTEGICAMAQKAITNYYEQKVQFAEAVLSAIAGTGEFIEWKDLEISTFKRGGNRLADVAHEVKIQSTLDWLRVMGCEQYTYICDGGEKSCEKCLSLDGQNFDIEKAVVGVNLPPMHPNCRCTIEAFPNLPSMNIITVLTNTMLLAIERYLHEGLEELQIFTDPAMTVYYEIWVTFFLDAVKAYCGMFSNYEINGENYQIKLDSFGGVSYLPDGTFIKPENLKPLDKQMLDLMRQRDEFPEGSSERMKIEEQITALNNEDEVSDVDLVSVNSKKPYSFYAFGGDITTQLYDYMHGTETKYAYMHERTWFENLIDFAKLVGNRCEMDLKNQPEWQHSAYVFNGEIVDQDTLGNINYGYFGKHCNIPDIVLIAGAGFAQLVAGSSDISFWSTLLDDPRDNDRVMQGIEIYNDLH